LKAGEESRGGTASGRRTVSGCGSNVTTASTDFTASRKPRAWARIA
jgi:hypothetical protein